MCTSITNGYAVGLSMNDASSRVSFSFSAQPGSTQLQTSYIIGASAATKFQYQWYSSKPTPAATTSPFQAANRCSAVKIGDTYTESCGLMTLTNQNCITFKESKTKTTSPSAQFTDYAPTLSGLAVDCTTTGEYGTVVGGRAISQFSLGNFNNAVTQSYYTYYCQFVADQGTTSSAATPSPSPYTTYQTSPTIWSRLADDLTLQTVTCAPTSLISYFQLTYTPTPSPAPTIAYSYGCIVPRIDAGYFLTCQSTTNTYTSNGAGYQFNYLDQQNVDCTQFGALYALQTFWLVSNPGDSTISYTYSCCKVAPTG
jgi:hypothetical protein